LGEARRYPEAIKALDRAMALNPENAEAHYRLGWLQDQMGNHSKALNSYKNALFLHPGHPGALMKISYRKDQRATHEPASPPSPLNIP